MSKERRQHPRVPASGPGSCAIRDEQGRERPFEIMDLSECGARLRCSTP